MPRMSLSTCQHSRYQLGKLIREFKFQSKQQRDLAGFRATVYGFSVLLQYFRLESELQIEQRLDEIENVIREHEA
jgi:hypothetical protein